MSFGSEPTDLNGIPISSVYVPGTGFIALKGSTNTNTDGSSNQSTAATMSGDYTETASLSAGALNADLVASVDVSFFKWFSVQVTGTWVGMLSFQGSNDNSNFVGISASPAGALGTVVSTATANGIYVGPVTFRYLRVRMTSYTSGTANGTLEAYTFSSAVGGASIITQSGGPVLVSGLASQAGATRLRTWAGLTQLTGTITSTLAGDTSLIFSVAPKTLLPGDAIHLGSGGLYSETVFVASSYTPSASATSIPLAAPVVTAGSTTAAWHTYNVQGPSIGAVLPDGVLPFIPLMIDNNSGQTAWALENAENDGMSSARLLAVSTYLSNGATMDRAQCNMDNISLLASAARTTTQTGSDQTNYNHRGVIVVLDMTVVGTGSVTLEIDGKDPVSGKYYPILTGAAVTTNSTNVYTVYPGNTVTANVSASTVLPRTWRVKVTANNANSCTYSVGALLIV